MTTDVEYQFPFRGTEEKEIMDLRGHSAGDQLHSLCSESDSLNFETFNYTEYKLYEIGSDTDPENHF